MNRRVYSTRTASAAKWCVALFGIAALPAWSFGQQAAPAKAEPTKAPEVKVTGTVTLFDPFAGEQKGTESELQALKAEMDALNARLTQLQAEKEKKLKAEKANVVQANKEKVIAAQKIALERQQEDLKIAAEKERQLSEAKLKLDRASVEASKAQDQILAARDAELKALEALKARRFEVESDQKETKIQQLKVQLAEVIGDASKQKAAVAADKASQLLTDLKATRVAAPTEAGARQVLRSGSQGVKVFGADGKEIPGVTVIIDHPTPTIKTDATWTFEAAPATKMVAGERLLFSPATTVQVAPGTPSAPAKSVTVQGFPIAPNSVQGFAVAPNPHQAPVRVEGVQLLAQPVPAGATPPAVDWSVPLGVRVGMPVVPGMPVSPPAGFGTFSAVAPAAPANSITLSRATYKLPKDKAATLSSLLSGLKHVVMEIKLDNDTLIVTTTPEAQREIAGFVKLITGGGVTFQFSVPLSNAGPAAPATPGAPSKAGSAKVVDIPLKDTTGFFLIEDASAPKVNIQKFQLKTGEKGEMTIVGAEDTKAKTTGSKTIEIRAKEENGKLTIETVDAVGPKPQAIQIKKNDKGETIIIGVAEGTDATKKPMILHLKKGQNGEMIIVGEGEGGTTGTIRLENLNKLTPLAPLAPAAPAAPAGVTVPAKPVAPAAPVKPAEAPKKTAAPASTGEKPK